MKKATLIGLGLATFLAIPAFASEMDAPAAPVHHHRVYRHTHHYVSRQAVNETATAQVAPPAAPKTWSLFPAAAPATPSSDQEENYTDGLSRGNDHCNFGCIDNKE